MISRICFSKTVREKVATPITPKDLQALMQSPFVQEICDKIVLLDGKEPEESYTFSLRRFGSNYIYFPA